MPDFPKAKPTVLIVDDTPENLRLLEEMLHGNGFRVAAFPSGRMALEAMKKVAPDIALLDIMMPDMDGYEVLARMKKDPATRDVPVIFISALGSAADKVKAFSAGGLDYVTKPFQREEVLARVHTHLSLRDLRLELDLRNRDLERQVAARTRELADANARLSEMVRVKSEFLSMISHEIRTPANGLLAVGELLCADGDAELRELFETSSRRLQALMDDASALSGTDPVPEKNMARSPLSPIFLSLEKEFPGVRFSSCDPVGRVKDFALADADLLLRALRTCVALARCFSPSAPTFHVADRGRLSVCESNLDALHLRPEQASTFFDLESKTRCASRAESLGLAPVVAEKILRSIGGFLTLESQVGAGGKIGFGFPVENAR